MKNKQYIKIDNINGMPIDKFIGELQDIRDKLPCNAKVEVQSDNYFNGEFYITFYKNECKK